MAPVQRSRTTLLVALGIDNLGAGLFLPLTLLYTTQVVGLPLPIAATAVTAGTVIGLAVPPFAGRFTDRIGPRPVVIAAQLIQAAAAACYLAADGVALVVAAALLQATGQQAFYSALFALVGDIVEDGPKDGSFTLVNMVRAATFGLGTLITAVVLGTGGLALLRPVIAIDISCLLLAALLLALFLKVPHRTHASTGDATGVLANRPYLALIVVAGLVVLAVDFALVGMPVYAVEVLGAPPWVPGVQLTVVTVLLATGGTLVLRWTRQLSRTDAVRAGAITVVAWCAACAAAPLIPPPWRPAFLIATTLLSAAYGLIAGGRLNALAEAAAPDRTRGSHLAAFQYAFTVAGVAAPALAALFVLGPWVPWLVIAAGALAAYATLPSVAERLPAHALRDSPL